MFSHRLATVWAGQPIRSAVSLALAGAGTPGVPPGQVFLEPRGKDQPVTTGQRDKGMGAGYLPFPGSWRGRGLPRRVGHPPW